MVAYLREGASEPVFPLRGQDVIDMGVKPGKQIGTILKSVEAAWIERDFKGSRETMLEELKEAVREAV
jgi:tRNA nucleotidyltransferase/poly(A) polymerase